MAAISRAVWAARSAGLATRRVGTIPFSWIRLAIIRASLIPLPFSGLSKSGPGKSFAALAWRINNKIFIQEIFLNLIGVPRREPEPAARNKA